jgi:hypothetical protein
LLLVFNKDSKMKTRFSKTALCRYPFDLDYPTLPDDIEVMDEADVVAFLEAKQADELEAANEAAKRYVPTSVTLYQARAALIQAGLMDKVSAAIAAIKDDKARALALNDWEYAPRVRRDSALVQSLAVGLKLDDAALDALFVAAGAL